MSEDNDYTPSSYYAGHDFKSVRASYDASAGRSYDDAKKKGKSNSDLLPESLTTNSTHPLVIELDSTGSMLDWPGVMVGKMGYMDHELRTQYLSEDMEISFTLHDDEGSGMDYYVQARPFAKGEDIVKRAKELVQTGSGGGRTHMCESSELPMLYYARRVTFPKAVIKPVYIIITDEMPYPSISPDSASYVHVKLKSEISTADVMKELQDKYSVYLIQKPYYNDKDERSLDTQTVRKEWLKYLDADRIAILPEAERVVDVIFGILAAEADKVEYFQKEIEDRQKPGQVATVYKALKTIHALSADASNKKSGGKSRMKGLGAGKKTKKLTTGKDEE
ncbi:MAG: hypothetical protein RLZZ324_149 [Candidatus Parcubacteria bacterium]|jgi:hypothetical protein